MLQINLNIIDYSNYLKHNKDIDKLLVDNLVIKL